jgi:hypothetical protein
MHHRFPPNIAVYYNRASKNQLNNLNQTFIHFGVNNNHSLVGEALLRLGKYLDEAKVCVIPNDPPSKALISMYKHFVSLN